MMYGCGHGSVHSPDRRLLNRPTPAQRRRKTRRLAEGSIAPLIILHPPRCIPANPRAHLLIEYIFDCRGCEQDVAPHHLPAAGFQQTVSDLKGGHAEVCYPDVVLFVEQQVLRLQIPVAEG